MTVLGLFGHSFGRLYNLPVPFWMYVYGASAALLFSFFVVAHFVSAPAVATLPRGREFPAPRFLLGPARALGVIALLLCIATGLFGSPNPYANFSMTFFWIVFLLGFTYVTALIGDAHAAINPWAALSFGNGVVTYPRRLAYWPALALYAAFIWLELFGNLRPLSLGVMLLTYLVVNVAGVALIGKRDWFQYCEFFSVFFRLVAKMAPIEARDGRLRLRWPFAGLVEERAEHLSLVVFVLFMLSSTAFDGLRETVPWLNLFWVHVRAVLEPLVGANPTQAYPALRALFTGWQTVALLLSPFVYLAVYVAFIALAKLTARSSLTVRELALRFAFSLLPIALVYHVTHYYTLLLTQGYKIVPLLSDPFGLGWNLFGTARWFSAPFIPDMAWVWNTQVALIVAGHIVSVAVAHVEALRTFPSPRQATLSQLPMLLLMVLFTTIGLWVLAQPISAPLS